MVDENRAEGTLRKLGGRLQDAVGGLTGDTSTQARGKANQAAGKAQDTYGQLLDEVRDFASDQPVIAVAASLAVGVALGFYLARR